MLAITASDVAAAVHACPRSLAVPPSPEFALLIRSVERLLSSGLPFGVAAIQAAGMPSSARSALKDIVAHTTEFVTWGRWEKNEYGLLFREHLLRETMPLCRRLLRKFPELRVGIALGSADIDATGYWRAARMALSDAIASREQMIVIQTGDAARRWLS